MLIDWFTVLAQIVNFLILMWLLKHFLYKPVLEAIDSREKRIADLLSDTEISQQKAEQQQADLAEKNKMISDEHSTLLKRAEEQAELIKQKMIKDASEEVTEKKSQWLSDLQKEKSNLEHDIAQRAQQEVFHVARKVLKDLSDVELETQVTKVFIKQLDQFDSQQRKEFETSKKNSLIIRSAMNLSDSDKERLQQVVSKIFSSNSSLKFEKDETLVSGIELVANDYKLSWNIDDYLSDMKESIASLVEKKLVESQILLRQQSTQIQTDEVS